MFQTSWQNWRQMTVLSSVTLTACLPWTCFDLIFCRLTVRTLVHPSAIYQYPKSQRTRHSRYVDNLPTFTINDNISESLRYS